MKILELCDPNILDDTSLNNLKEYIDYFGKKSKTIVTAIAATFMFILSGQLEISYSLCLGTFCTIAALIGSFYILKYINKTGRSSVLYVIMEYFLIASLFIAIYKIFTLDLKDTSFIGSLFITNKFCW